MAAGLDLAQARARYPVGELLVQVRGREGVVSPAQDEGRAGDGRQVGAAVGAGDDRAFLPLETLRAYGVGHLPDNRADPGVLDPVGVDYLGQEQAPHLVEPARPGKLDEREPRLRLPRGVGPGRGVEQGGASTRSGACRTTSRET